MADSEKRTYFGLHAEKLIFSVIMSVVVVICGVLSAQIYYEVMLSVFSIVTIVYIVEGKLVGCVCGAVYCAASAAISYSRQLYGLMLFQIVFAVPLYIASIFTWKKNQNKSAVEVKRLPLGKLAFVITAAAAAYGGVFFLLKAIGSTNIPIDSLTLILSISGMVLLSLRYIEQWYFNLAANISVVVLWAFKIAESLTNINFMIIAIISTGLNILGLVSWVKMREKDTDLGVSSGYINQERVNKNGI